MKIAYKLILSYFIKHCKSYEEEYAGIVVLIASAAASFIFGVLSDKIGRKNILVYKTLQIL